MFSSGFKVFYITHHGLSSELSNRLCGFSNISITITREVTEFIRKQIIMMEFRAVTALHLVFFEIIKKTDRSFTSEGGWFRYIGCHYIQGVFLFLPPFEAP